MLSFSTLHLKEIYVAGISVYFAINVHTILDNHVFNYMRFDYKICPLGV